MKLILSEEVQKKFLLKNCVAHVFTNLVVKGDVGDLDTDIDNLMKRLNSLISVS